MLKSRLIDTLAWLRADMRNACAMVYSCLDNNAAVVDEVCEQIAAPVERFAALVWASRPFNRCQEGE